MAVRNYSNITNVGTLSGAVGTGEGTLLINGGWSNLPTFPFYVIVDRGQGTEECMLATGGNATALNVTRGYDGSPASSHGTNATVEVAVLAEFFNKADQHVEASTNVHGLAGGSAVVGTTTTQTLTNKTINSSVLNLAHSSSPAGAQAIQVAADAATARHGFLWTKTAAATGDAFRATSSGTTRFSVDADGKVVLNSGAGSDKALAVQQSGTERFSMLNDGTADFGLQASLASADRVTIRNRPTQNALRIKDESGFNIFTIGTAGNVDASGYVAAVGNVSSAAAVSSGTTLTAGTNLVVNGTAAVTGTSTLTGDVTLPLPAAGTTPRLTVRGRTGSNLIEGRNQANTVMFAVSDAGQIVSSARAFIHDGASPVVANVTGTGVVPSPTSRVMVFDDSDFTLKRHNGTIWETVGRYGTHFTGANALLPSARRTANLAAVTTTETQFLTTGTISLLASSAYRVDVMVSCSTSVANDEFNLKVRDTNTSGTVRMEVVTERLNSSLPIGFKYSFIYKTTSAEASRSFIASIVRQNGTGNIVVQTGSHMDITYLGPSSLVTDIT